MPIAGENLIFSVAKVFQLIDPNFMANEGYGRSRDGPLTIYAVQKLGGYTKRGGVAAWRYEDIKLVDIPNDVDWEICEYDGSEWIAEKHRKWY